MGVGDACALRDEIERAIGQLQNVRVDEIEMTTLITLKFRGQRLTVQPDDQTRPTPGRPDCGPRRQLVIEFGPRGGLND